MNINQFNDLIKRGFEPSFNFNDVYYRISISDQNIGQTVISLANEKNEVVEFKDIDELDNHYLEGKKIKDIIPLLSDDDIFY